MFIEFFFLKKNKNNKKGLMIRDRRINPIINGEEKSKNEHIFKYFFWRNIVFFLKMF